MEDCLPTLPGGNRIAASGGSGGGGGPPPPKPDHNDGQSTTTTVQGKSFEEKCNEDQKKILEKLCNRCYGDDHRRMRCTTCPVCLKPYGPGHEKGTRCGNRKACTWFRAFGKCHRGAGCPFVHVA